MADAARHANRAPSLLSIPAASKTSEDSLQDLMEMKVRGRAQKLASRDEQQPVSGNTAFFKGWALGGQSREQIWQSRFDVAWPGGGVSYG